MVGMYVDKNLVPQRHIGRMRYFEVGIRAYIDPRLVITGTLVSTPTEAQVIAGGTLILTLSEGKWVPSGAIFNAARQSIIDGLDSDKSEATGWNTLVRDALAVTAVVRTSDTICTVTVPATPGYCLTANETVTFSCPRGAIDGYTGLLPDEVAIVVNATPTVTAALTGTFLTTPTEGEVVSGGQAIIITLTGGTWVPAGATFNAVRQAIINGMDSAGSAANGWDAEVKAKEVVAAVVRTGNTICTITLTASAAYSIAAEEVVTVTVPRLAIATADADVVAAPTIAIQPD